MTMCEPVLAKKSKGRIKEGCRKKKLATALQCSPAMRSKTSIYLNLPLNHLIIIINQKHPGIRRFGIELVGEDNIEQFVAPGPFLVAWRGISFTFRVRVIVDHLALVLLDIVK